MFCEHPERQLRRQPMAHNIGRLGAPPFGEPVLLEDGQHLVFPQQFRNDEQARRWISGRWPLVLEYHGAILHSRRDAPPPLRHHTHGFGGVARAHNQRHSVEDLVVEIALGRQSIKRVAVAL